MHQLKHHEDLMMYFRDAFKIQSKIYDGAFLQKSSIVNVRLGFKYASALDEKLKGIVIQIT